MCPSPSRSASLIISSTSSSVSFSPRLVITCPSSAADIRPFPSLSKTLKASTSSSSVSVSFIFRAIKDKLLFKLTNFGQPFIYIEDGNYENRGELFLRHDHQGVDLDLEKARETLRCLFRVWKRPAALATTLDGRPTTLRYDGKELRNFGDDNNIGNRTWLQGSLIRIPGTIGDPHAIVEDSKGTLWIGAFDSGVWRHDGKAMTNFTTKDGLPTDSVSAIYEDRSGKLWFGTFKGVCTFDGKSFSVVGEMPKPENR